MTEETAPMVEPSADRDLLKEAFRSLARRYHPDLARTEEERVQFGSMMARINALYRAGDIERLRGMAEQAKGGEIDDPELSPAEQIELLTERLQRFATVVVNLKEERTELEASSTCELMRNVEQAETQGQDLIEEIRGQLAERVDAAYGDIRSVVTLLEDRVNEYNRAGAGKKPLTARRRNADVAVFDPFADKGLVRLGLDHLTTASASPEARKIADWVEQEAGDNPPMIRLLLMTYVSELSPFPLEGLDDYEKVRERFDFLNGEDGPELEQALVDADDLVEYGVKRATADVAHLGLRFRSDPARDSIPIALERVGTRRLFREVLGVLSDAAECEGCGSAVYPVPLYRLRGLDDLRAHTCPECGHTLSSYWMPKGKDVQAVLNPVFLDYELVSEWSFKLARTTIAIQLVPAQVDHLTVGQLKKRLVDDVFARHNLEVTRKQVRLMQAGARVVEKTALEDLDDRSFQIRFDEDCEITEGDALEQLRHRIRTRFS